MSHRVRRFGPFVITAAVAFAAPAVASAQATRTWVSGVGDDANACSRTAPCKTFAGAIAKTAPGGEIDALDSGGFGALTITKSITINATGVTGGVLTFGTNAFVVAAGPTDTVTIEGLDFDGLGQSLAGIEVLSAKTVHIEHDEIYGFDNGISISPSNPIGVTVENTSIHDNSYAGILAPGSSTGSTNLTINNSELDSNTCGLSLSLAFSTDDCLATDAGAVTNPVRADVANTEISGNTDAGVETDGAGATAELSGDLIENNGVGVRADGSSTLIEYGANEIFGNAVDGTPTAVEDPYIGPAGPQGSVGPQGTNGTDGTNGATGATGAAGPAGAPGSIGVAGATGATGPKGDKGATGPRGPKGPKGPKGDKGSSSASTAPRVVACTGTAKGITCSAKLNQAGLTAAALHLHGLADLFAGSALLGRGATTITGTGVSGSVTFTGTLEPGVYTLHLVSGGQVFARLSVTVKTPLHSPLVLHVA